MNEGLEVRGHSRFDLRAPFSARALALLADCFVGWLIALCVYRILGWEPLPGWKFALVAAAGLLLPAIAGKKLFGRRLGERIWGTRAGKTRPRERGDTLRGAFLTLFLAIACGGIFYTNVLEHPYWRFADADVLIPAVVPPSDWKVLAFYYTLAPWPAAVGGEPVFYSVPYEIGPPKRFVGDVTADWIPESVRLRIEGPRTPMDYQSRALARSRLRECFASSPLLEPDCAWVRKITLERHLEDLHAEGYAKFEIAWFSAENPGIPDAARAQGVRLRATAGSRTQDRYILITPNGIHEAIELSYLDNQEGHLAEKDLRVALGALRISEDLAPGRAWTDSLLESVHLDRLPPIASSAYASRLADIQSSLVSMISVNPASFEAYYHLAGSSLLLLQYAARNPGTRASLLRSLAQDMVARMARYGHDVDPASPELFALDQLAKEAKQF